MPLPMYNQRPRSGLVPNENNPTPSVQSQPQWSAYAERAMQAYLETIQDQQAAAPHGRFPEPAPQRGPSTNDPETMHRYATKPFLNPVTGNRYCNWAFAAVMSKLAYGVTGGLSGITSLIDGTLTVLTPGGGAPPGLLWKKGNMQLVAIAGLSNVRQAMSFATYFGLQSGSGPNAGSFWPFGIHADTWTTWLYHADRAGIFDKTKPTVFCGHSMGGAIAALMLRSHVAANNGAKAAMGYGFGVPRCVNPAKSDFDDLVGTEFPGRPFQRVAFSFDPVRLLPWYPDNKPMVFPGSTYSFTEDQLTWPGPCELLGWENPRYSLWTPPSGVQRPRLFDWSTATPAQINDAVTNFHAIDAYIDHLSRPFAGSSWSSEGWRNLVIAAKEIAHVPFSWTE